MKFSQFMSSGVGRGLRIAVGLVLIIVALAVLFPAGQTVWTIVMLIVGLFFVAVGAANVCILGPLFGGSLNGRDYKKQ